MRVKYFFRLYFGLLLVIILSIIFLLSLNIANADEIVIYHSRYFKVNDYIRTGRISFGLPFIYRGYKIRTKNNEINFPESDKYKVTVSSNANLFISSSLTYDLDLRNIEYILSKYGYIFDEKILEDQIKETISNFIHSIPVASMESIDKIWISERIKELLTILFLENGLILKDLNINQLNIERDHQIVSEDDEIKKPNIAVFFVPGLHIDIYDKIHGQLDDVVILPIKNNNLLNRKFDEKIFTTGKLPHKSMLYLDKKNIDFQRHRSRYLWEILDYYTSDITLLFSSYVDKSHVKDHVNIMSRDLVEKSDIILSGNYYLKEGLYEIIEEIKIEKDAFDRKFRRETKIADDSSYNKISSLRNRLYFELALTEKSIENRSSVFISFINTLDEIMYNYIDYTFPRDQDILLREYMKYNSIVSGTRIIVEDYIMKFVKDLPDNTIIMIISPYQYKKERNKPRSMVNRRSSYLKDDGFVIFIKKGLEKEIYLTEDRVELWDFFPSLLNLYGYPHARDLRGSMLLSSSKKPRAVRLITSYDGILKDNYDINILIEDYEINEQKWIDNEVFISDEVLSSKYDHKNYQEITDRYTFILNEYPFIFEIMPKLGLLSYLNNDASDAKNYYKRYIINSPYSPRGLYNLGTAHLSMHEYRKAIESYINCYNISHLCLRTINNLAFALYKIRDYQSAGSYFKKSLNIDSDQKDLLDFLTRDENPKAFKLDIYEDIKISFYKIEMRSVDKLRAVINTLSKLDSDLITHELFESIKDIKNDLDFDEIIIRKSELNKDLEREIDKVPLRTFSNIFQIGEKFVVLYKFDINKEKN